MTALWLCALTAIMALAAAFCPTQGFLSTACCLAAALCAIATGVCILCGRRRSLRRLDQMKQKAEDFVHKGVPYEVPLEEDSLAAVEQALAQLCQLTAMERKKSARQAHQTAELIADIAHQWRTPLSSLKLYLELDLQSGRCCHSQKQLALIERMESMVESLLRLEKLRTHAYEMHFAPVDISSLCAQLCGELTALFPDKRFILPQNPLILRCDRQWIAEALVNLLKNACQHTAPNGVILLDCRCHGRYGWISVEDDGGGVPPDALPRLFERFYRPPGSSSEGTGLGLAIAKAICESHHGDMAAQNTGRGLKVSLLLPLQDNMLRQTLE